MTDQTLVDIFQQEEKALQSVSSPAMRESFGLLREFCLRPSSKRIRALLVFLGYESTGKRAPRKLAKVAAAIEIVHNYLLIHDDIIDRDERRRGGLTVHEALRRILPGNAEEKHHRGVSMALLTGDFASLLAFRLFLESGFPQPKAHAATLQLFRTLQHETVVGEYMDVEQAWERKMDKRVIAKIAELKTASYTFGLPLIVGSLFAGASKVLQRDLMRYAIPVGVGFQMADDLIGFAPSRKSGKSSNDVREGKVTEIILEARKRITPKQRVRLDRLFRRSQRSPAQVSEIRKIIQASGALEVVQEKAKQYGRIAKESLQQSRRVDKKCASMLAELADISVYRSV